VQVKNAEPRFMAREGKKTLPFCCKLMKAEGFTSTFDFSIHVAFARSLGKRRRMPPFAGVRLMRFSRQCVSITIRWPIACSARLPIWPLSAAGHGICQWQPVHLTGDPRAAVYV
jgi:incFII family plasmid replication initiator RepA